MFPFFSIKGQDSLSFLTDITIINPSLYQSAVVTDSTLVIQEQSVTLFYVSVPRTQTRFSFSIGQVVFKGLTREMGYRRKTKSKSASAQVTECPQHRTASSKQESHFTSCNLKRYSYALCCSVHYKKND